MALFIPLYFYHTICMLSFATHSQPYKNDLPQDYLSQTDLPNPHLGGDHPGGLRKVFAKTATTDESKLMLALLVNEKIDKNKDDSVQLDELVSWINKCQDKYTQQDVDRHWSTYKQNFDADGTLGWQTYIDREYDHLVTIAEQSSDSLQVDKIRKSHDHHVKRDRRRWKSADSNQDGRLNKDEFKLFYYPEHSKLMHDVLVQEKFEMLDGNQDGKISADEFMTNVTPNAAYRNLDEQEKWAQQQRVDFQSKLDKNHDNYLDKSELAQWVTTSNFHDNSITEAQYLMQVADTDHNHRLSDEEILASYQEFVNSHATDFGEALRAYGKLSHDEL